MDSRFSNSLGSSRHSSSSYGTGYEKSHLRQTTISKEHRRGYRPRDSSSTSNHHGFGSRGPDYTSHGYRGSHSREDRGHGTRQGMRKASGHTRNDNRSHKRVVSSLESSLPFQDSCSGAPSGGCGQQDNHSLSKVLDQNQPSTIGAKADHGSPPKVQEKRGSKALNPSHATALNPSPLVSLIPKSEEHTNTDDDKYLNEQNLQNIQEGLSKLTISEDNEAGNLSTAEKAGKAALVHQRLDEPLLGDFRLSWRVQLAIQRLAESVCSRYQARDEHFRECTVSSSNNSYSNTTPSTSENEVTQADSGSRQLQRPEKKRKLGQNFSEDESDEEQTPDKTSQGTREGLTPRLACPFYKDNRSKYGDRVEWPCCSGPGWPTMHRLKEHLYRQHMKPKHCVRCWMLFPDKDALDDHSRSDSQCLVVPAKRIDGLDENQANKLRSRKEFSKLKKERSKWRKAYGIIFPDVPEDERPEPYYDTEDSTEKREAYLREELPKCLKEVLLARLSDLPIDWNDLGHICEVAVSKALDNLSRPEHAQYKLNSRTLDGSKIPVAHVVNESSGYANADPRAQSQTQTLPPLPVTTSYSVAHSENNPDALSAGHLADQDDGIPNLDPLWLFCIPQLATG